MPVRRDTVVPPGPAYPSVEAHRLLFDLYKNGARAVLTPKAIRVISPKGGPYRLSLHEKAAIKRNAAGVKKLLRWDADEADVLRRHAGHRVQGVSVRDVGDLFDEYAYALTEMDEAIRVADMGLVRYYCWRALGVASEIRGTGVAEPPPSTGMQPELGGA